ncbi:MAG: class I adenylate-forming enzyme family protein [Xenococcus sp. (in: cyanobacteria)]
MKFIAEDLSNQILTDGQLTCSYQDLEEILRAIQGFLAAKGVTTEFAVVLECENSLAVAVVLLSLLEGGYSVLLLPRSKEPTTASSFAAEIPHFCHYKLVVENLVKEVSELYNPEPWLNITQNDSPSTYKPDRDRPKLYMRTSGSTGKPKITVHSHENLQQNILNCVKRLRLTSADRIAIPVPLYHMYGLGAAFLPGVAAGAGIDLQKGANLLRYLQRERAFDPNVAFMTPIFCETLNKGRRSARPYRLTVTAGDRLRANTLAAYESRFGCLVQLYGSTEMGAIAAGSPDDPQEIRATTVGKPLDNVKMRLQDDETIPEDRKDVGKLWCQHQYGFEGYIDESGNDIPLNDDDGWFSTKDLGKITSNGEVEVLGRFDFSINRDGLLVFFSDVEKVVNTISGVDTAVVVSGAEGARGKELVAYCILESGDQSTVENIRAACFDLLPKRAVPDKLSIVKSFPLLPNGKIDRQELIKIAKQSS